MDDRNRQLGASTTAPTIAPPCTECRGFQVSALVRGNWRRGTCPACGGAGTAEAQQARSAPVKSLVADVRKSISDGSFVDSWPDARDMPVFRTPSVPPAAPQPEPAEAAGEVLPLWVQRYGAFWSRGDYAARVEVFARGDAFRGRGSAPDGSELRCGDYTSVEAAMSAIDEAAVRAGHRLPADSMAFRPELADEVRGTAWEWSPGDDVWSGDGDNKPLAFTAFNALFGLMGYDHAADALARILRVHGADVREVP